ncbi:Rne/Rng family ribonuclease [Cytobacillus gottheilii]|uniref:Rne/Rng family ribonuclease n=1 Tax=Cytobacillus gottheilii TaxID=859144 RepID=UPI0009BA5AF2|nr:Rne/Rng family ribonuclease [Cytobacillus gottheilii]
MEKLIINSSTREKRYILLKENKVDKLIIEQPKSQAAVGNIYLGLTEKVLPGLNAAFIGIGQEKSGFLHKEKLSSYVNDEQEKAAKESRSISTFIHQGEKMLVQIEKDADGTKGPRLTGLIELAGDHLIYMPEGRYVAISKKIDQPADRQRLRSFGMREKNEREGLIFRTSALLQPESILLEELKRLREQYEEISAAAASKKKPGVVYEENLFLQSMIEEVKKMKSGDIVVDDLSLKDLLVRYTSLPVTYYADKENIFAAYSIEGEIEKAIKRIVWLNQGSYLIFDEAEALTVIDVNTGKFSGKQSRQDTVYKTNELAAREAARQIRLRDLAGIILIDFIDMGNENDRKAILNVMKAELMKDERQTKLIGFTPLGILQLTRKKTKNSLRETLTSPCGVCHGTGRVFSAESIAFRLERELWEYRSNDHEAVLIGLTEDVKDIFTGENAAHQSRLEEMLGLKIVLVNTEDKSPSYEIKKFGAYRDLKKNLH